jgi:hypothetical protein
MMLLEVHDRIDTLTAEVHDLARRIVEADRAARAHAFHGRYTRAAAALARRECIVDQRYMMLRELLLERLLLPTL